MIQLAKSLLRVIVYTAILYFGIYPEAGTWTTLFFALTVLNYEWTTISMNESASRLTDFLNKNRKVRSELPVRVHE